MAHRPYPNRDRARRQVRHHHDVKRRYARAIESLNRGTLYDYSVTRFGSLTVVAALVTDGGLPSPGVVRRWDEARRALWRAHLRGVDS